MKKEQGQVKPAAATGGGNPGGGVTKAPTPDGGGGVKSDNDLSGTDLGNTPIGTPMGSVASAGGPPDRYYILTSHSQTCNDRLVFQIWVLISFYF